MKITLDIDTNNVKAIALVNYLRTLDFIKFEEGSYLLTELQKKAIEKGIDSFEKGKGVPHGQVVNETKSRYPEIFNK